MRLHADPVPTEKSKCDQVAPFRSSQATCESSLCALTRLSAITDINSNSRQQTCSTDGLYGQVWLSSTRRDDLCRDAVVVVVQTADFWKGDNATG